MSDLDANRLIKTFAELQSANSKTLVPFITAGHPDMETTGALLGDFEARGVRICELGIPYSDPVADGPVIQTSYTKALEAGTTSKSIFAAVSKYRSGGGQLALVAMVSYAIVYRHGVEEYLASARQAGFDGVIIPDLSLEEAGNTERLAAAQALCNVMLVAPTTPPDRRLRIASHCRGFIYYVSVTGITGEREKLPDETIQAVSELRTHTDTPICVGFGISNAATVEHVCQVADGAIVGSAIVRRIQDAAAVGTDRSRLVKQIGEFISELLAPIIS